MTKHIISQKLARLNILILYLTEYVEELYKVLTTSSSDELAIARRILKENTPKPINRMLDRVPKEVAIKKYMERKAMSTVDVPGTSSGG